MKIDKATLEMIKECDCENCKDMHNCNLGADLVNCYATLKLKVKK